MKSIRYCLNKQLAEICQQSMQLEELSEKVLKLLPQELAPYCQVASFNKGCLHLTTSDANWASQLRYALPELRDRLRTEAQMYQLTSIKIIIATPNITPEKDNKKTLALSNAAKATIISESQNCSYQPLRTALLHLAEWRESEA